MPSLREAAEQLSQKEGENTDLEEKFSDMDTIEKDSVVQEEKLRHEVEPKAPGKAAGIDGGLIRKRYSYADVVAVRAVSAVFSFNSSGLEKADYLPGKSPEPEFHVFDPQDQEGLDRKAEAERLKAETEIALHSQKETDKVFMDGSVIPSYSQDEKVLENYNRLFSNAEPGSLIGVVEDSYGTSLTDILEEKTGLELGNIRDTLLMDAILSEGERSFVRKYSKGPAEHPVLKKLHSNHVNKLYTFYVRLSSKDIPLRIDYYGNPDNADQIAGELMALKSSECYTVPSPVLEADRKAKVPGKYLKRLEKRFSPSLKRRERRNL
ncbi:MAG: hypothetical protein BRC28_03550 [Nanohaloarchaea archaeon SW_4_43_9]|nr:MAG: hypothetical protein BRC28_03550 [Nanohaloarchaea archaeon SW_4_43_9]